MTAKEKANELIEKYDKKINSIAIKPIKEASLILVNEVLESFMISIPKHQMEFWEEVKKEIKEYLKTNDIKIDEMKEEITGTAEIRETYKISKVGTIAGCMVSTGKIYRNSGIRLIREGVVVFTGKLTSLKRFKDDVKEVAKGYDCGIQIKNFNDIKELDVLECFQEVAVKKKL